MFSDTFLASKNVLNSSFRWIIINIDHAVYGLLELIYQLFFNVASSDFFSNATVVKFYGRVQLILGIFMMFQLAMVILKGIVNPDSFTDKKSGAGNLVTRVITALVLLTVLVPINVPKDPASMNEYEIQINNNGLLFGTLYSLQYRLLAGNVLGKLILGTTEADTFDISENEDGLYDSAKTFTSTIVRGFYRINLIPYEERTHDPDKDDAEIVSNRMCEDMGDALSVYTSPDSSAGEIIAVANETCSENKILGLLGKTVSAWAGNEMYMFTIMPFVSTAAAIIFIFIFISFTIDVAVRAIKLAVLRLIAPIPIISYMDPKGSKDSAFNAWVKSLTSTYLDLFVRLATIYFVLFIIRDMISNGIVVGGSGLLKTLSIIAIWIGLFAFAKQAPKFIRQVLGLKDEGGKGLFSGFGEIGNAVGMGAAFVGGIGAARAASLASRYADETNGNKPNSFLNRGKHLLAGIAGGVTGVSAGLNAAMNAKDNVPRAVLDAQHKRNATAVANGYSGATTLGQFGASAARAFMGETVFDKETHKAAVLKARGSTGEDLFNYIQNKGQQAGSSAVVSAKYGNSSVKISLDEFNKRKARALADQQHNGGNGSFTIGSHVFNVNEGATKKFEEDLILAAGTQWVVDNSDDAPLVQRLKSFREAGGTYEIGTTTMDDLKKAYKGAKGDATRIENDAKYQRAKANYGANDKK